jgi:flagellar basal-body rod protein FlgG
VLATASSGDPITGAPGTNSTGKLIQGSLESSNVNVVEELVGMIETQRSYEVNSKAIAAVDGMQKYLTNNT